MSGTRKEATAADLPARGNFVAYVSNDTASFLGYMIRAHGHGSGRVSWGGSRLTMPKKTSMLKLVQHHQASSTECKTDAVRKMNEQVHKGFILAKDWAPSSTSARRLLMKTHMDADLAVYAAAFSSPATAPPRASYPQVDDELWDKVLYKIAAGDAAVAALFVANKPRYVKGLLILHRSGGGSPEEAVGLRNFLASVV